MNTVTAGVTTLAAAGASLLSALSLAGPAQARRGCNAVPKSPLVPYVTSPCGGRSIAQGTKSFTFLIHDGDSQSKRYSPFLNLQVRRKLVHGHLPDDTNGNGLFDNLKRVKGRPGEWTDVVRDQTYPSYWLNHPGTYYLQVQQVDTRAGVGDTFYSPIVTIKVR